MSKRSRSELAAFVKYRADVLGILQPDVARGMGMSVSTLKHRLDAPLNMTFAEFIRLMEIIDADDYSRKGLLENLGGMR